MDLKGCTNLRQVLLTWDLLLSVALSTNKRTHYLFHRFQESSNHPKSTTTGKAVRKLSEHLTSSEHLALLDSQRCSVRHKSISKHPKPSAISTSSPCLSLLLSQVLCQTLGNRQGSNSIQYHPFTVCTAILQRKGQICAQMMTGIPLEMHLKIWLSGRGTKNFKKGINVHGCFPTCSCIYSFPRQEVTVSTRDQINC